MAPLIEVPGGEIEVILRASEVPDSRRDFLLERINSVIASNWRSNKSTWWSRDHSPFRDDFGLAFFHAAGEIVAYFIYQRLTIDGTPVFYGAGTAVTSRHQGKRYYQMMQAHALTAAWQAIDPSPTEVYVAWRTRNPAIWISNSRFCSKVTPSLWDGQEDPKLQEACLRVAGELYPGRAVETPTMLMHNVFDDLIELRPKRYPAGSMGARLTEILANPADAIFSLGVVERATFQSLSRALETHTVTRARSQQPDRAD